MKCDLTADQLARFAAGETLDPETARRAQQLAEYAAGQADDAAARRIEQHLEQCPACRRRLAALRQADRALAALAADGPSPAALLATRRALRRQTRPDPTAPEVMTLDEVAAFLRLSPAEMDAVADELPAFELAGCVRVRRDRLIQWIEQRERDHLRDTIAGRVARNGAPGWKGVA